MDCADCALSLERSLGQIKGIEQVNVNFTTGRMDASGDFDPKELIQRVEALGYHAESPEQTAAGKIAGTSDFSPGSTIQLPGFLGYLYSTPQTRLALLGALLLLISIPLSLAANNPQILWVQTILQGLAAIIAGFPIANRGVRALVFGRQITIDLLMAIATLGALLIGETGEAATVVMLFAIGEALEGYTTERARNSLRSLIALKPDVAHVMRPCMDCAEHMGQQGYQGGVCPICGAHETSLPVEQVAVGELVIV